MVENSKFLNRLRNGHLEKSVATGICRVRRSPKTAKTPRKVHLRLRFQNLGKPRTAGLCGRAAGACDCGPLSCAFIERVNKGRKPPKRDLVGRGIRIPKGSVSHCRTGFTGLFHTSLTNAATFVSRGCVGLHTPPRLLTVHTAAHTAKHGRFGWGWYHYPRSVPHVSETLRGRGIRTAYFAALGSWPGGALEERRKPSGQRCAYACRCPEASRPRWAA